MSSSSSSGGSEPLGPLDVGTLCESSSSPSVVPKELAMNCRGIELSGPGPGAGASTACGPGENAGAGTGAGAGAGEDPEGGPF